MGAEAVMRLLESGTRLRGCVLVAACWSDLGEPAETISVMSQYVRVKRKNQTVFLYADPGEKIIDVKRKLAKINEKSLEDLGLLFNDTKLENDMTVGDYKIENDNVIFMVYKKPDSEAYEEVDIHKTSASEDGSEVKE